MFYFLLPKLTNESEVGRNQQSGIFHALGCLRPSPLLVLDEMTYVLLVVIINP